MQASTCFLFIFFVTVSAIAGDTDLAATKDKVDESAADAKALEENTAAAVSKATVTDDKGEAKGKNAFPAEAQGGNYQQYMKQYAGDYQKYMKQGSQGGQGKGAQQSQGADYQQYMKQYAGDYQKYLKQGGKGGQGQGGQQSQGGDYQQYMKQYAGDYQKYMMQGSQGGQGKGAQQSQGGEYQMYTPQGIGAEPVLMAAGEKSTVNQGGGYQHHMNQYASDYQKYMKQGGQGGQGHGGEQSQSGDFQQYMKQYAGDYQKYMKQGSQGGQGQGGQQSQGGDYQQYMTQYAGDYQKYGDYQNYMKQSGQGGQGGQPSTGGNYQQYMKQYASDYQTYTSQGAEPVQMAASENFTLDHGDKQSQGGDYQQYMKQYASDYQKYMKQGGQGGQQSSSGDYQQYIKHYAGDYQKYMKQGGQGGSKGSGYEQYMKQYAGNYQKYMKQGSGGNSTPMAAVGTAAPAQASDCHNLTELRAWKSAQLQKIDTYIPKEYQSYAKSAMEHTFNSSKEHIVAEQAKSSTGGIRLRAEMPAEAEPVQETYVPKEYQSSAKSAMEHTFNTSRDRVGAEQAKAPANSTGLPADVSLADEGTKATSKQTFPTPLKSNAATQVLAEQATATTSFVKPAALAGIGALVGVALFVSKRQAEVRSTEGYLNLLGEP